MPSSLLTYTWLVASGIVGGEMISYDVIVPTSFLVELGVVFVDFFAGTISKLFWLTPLAPCIYDRTSDFNRDNELILKTSTSL
jgi:hypothetical protein